MKGVEVRHWHPARIVGRVLAGSSLVALVVAGSGIAGGAASLPGEFTNGTAAATAQSMKFNPTAGQLSIGITFGTSLAGYTNEVAKAESRGIDLGVIGTTLAASGCDGSAPSLAADKQPQPITVDSRDTSAAGGKSGPETFYGYALPMFQKSAKATPQPFSQATTLSGPLGQPGLIEFAGVKSDAVTRVLTSKTREAIATTDVDSISLYNGLVQLGGLHWQVVHHSGTDANSVASFSLGTMSVNNTPVPIPSSDPSAAFNTANTALAPLGIQLRPPAVHNDKTTNKVSIDPMAIAVVPNATRDSIAGALLGGAQPVRQQLTDAMLKQSCKNGTYITVADIAVGSITGSGSFSLELGGVSASTGEVKVGRFLRDIPPFVALDDSPALEAADFSNGSNFDLGSNGPLVEGSVTTGPAAARGSRAPVTAGATPIVATKGSRGGRLAALAAGTLLLLALVAEGDRRKMRRAQRMIPLEG